MLSQEYKEISPEQLQQAYSSAWSIENMAAHDAEGRSVEYIGSSIKGAIINDYYQDNTGAWWYGTRAIVDGQIVSMEVYIFGRDIKKERLKRWIRNT